MQNSWVERNRCVNALEPSDTRQPADKVAQPLSLGNRRRLIPGRGIMGTRRSEWVGKRRVQKRTRHEKAGVGGTPGIRGHTGTRRRRGLFGGEVGNGTKPRRELVTSKKTIILAGLSRDGQFVRRRELVLLTMPGDFVYLHRCGVPLDRNRCAGVGRKAFVD